MDSVDQIPQPYFNDSCCRRFILITSAHSKVPSRQFGHHLPLSRRHWPLVPIRRLHCWQRRAIARLWHRTDSNLGPRFGLPFVLGSFQIWGRDYEYPSSTGICYGRSSFNGIALHGLWGEPSPIFGTRFDGQAMGQSLGVLGWTHGWWSLGCIPLPIWVLVFSTSPAPSLWCNCHRPNENAQRELKCLFWTLKLSFNLWLIPVNVF